MDILIYCLAKFEVMRTMRRDERGVTALEYGLIAAFIAVAIIAAVTTLGTSLRDLFAAISGRIATATAAV